MKVLILCLFIALSTAVNVIKLVDVQAGLVLAPWDPTPAAREYANNPSEAYNLPHRYGFVVEGEWNFFDSAEEWAQYPVNYQPPSQVWLRLCDIAPRTGEDYNLLVRGFWNPIEGCADGSPCLASNFDFRLVGLKDDGSWETIQSAVLSNDGLACLSRQFTFNLKSARTAYPAGLYYVVEVADPWNESGDEQPYWELRVQRVGTQWDITTCDSTSLPAYSSCSPSPSVLAECDDGVFDPANEDCDFEFDDRCLDTCTCPQPMIPDGKGACTNCGNGFIEPLSSEVCDKALDENCSDDCTACAEGFAFNDDGACVTCGNGVREAGEVCDYEISKWCTKQCVCWSDDEVTYIPDGKGGCTLCGNGQLDAGEFCDSTSAKCANDCSGCAAGWVPAFGEENKGQCTQCGNGVVDAGEVCDVKTDLNCADDCMGCIDDDLYKVNDGVCNRCGNGYLDAGENCDSLRSGCNSACSACKAGWVPAWDKFGSCTTCGNGVVEPDEVCDTKLDSNCASDCGGCNYPFAPVGHSCSRCGNGRLDRIRDEETGEWAYYEACDSAQNGCASDCTACEDGWSSSDLASGVCTPDCQNCCAELAQFSEETNDDLSPASALAVSFVALASAFLVAFH